MRTRTKKLNTQILKDPHGNQYRYTRDLQGRLQAFAIYSAAGRILKNKEFDYDLQGHRVVKHLDSQGKTIKTEMVDPAGRILKSRRFRYDSAGHLMNSYGEGKQGSGIKIKYAETPLPPPPPRRG